MLCCAGVEAALSWLVLNEGNPVLDEPLQAAPVAPRPMFSTANAGVGGILRREEQKAAETNRYRVVQAWANMFQCTNAPHGTNELIHNELMKTNLVHVQCAQDDCPRTKRSGCKKDIA